MIEPQSKYYLLLKEKYKNNNLIKIMKIGISDKEKVIIEQDRAEAISMAINELKKDEILLITGKGHEEYQDLGKKRIFFSDKQIVQKFKSPTIFFPSASTCLPLSTKVLKFSFILASVCCANPTPAYKTFLKVSI